MRKLSCDVAVIGAGTAGLAARRAAAGSGARTILIERGPGGTTCARVGCMPSKLLIAAAGAARDAQGLGRFGLRLDGRLAVDGPAVMERVRRERDHFVGAVLDDIATIPDGEKLDGSARFTGPGALSVGEAEIEARAIVIATGSRPSVPKPLAPLGGRVLTSDTVFELPDLPASLAVVGAGPLGIELAAAFAGLGVRVAVFDKGETLGGLSDPAVADMARELLGRGMEVHLGVEIEAAPDGGDGARITWRGKDGGTGSASFARVLAAAGRTPNLDGLALERAGLALDEDGVPVFDRETLRCGESRVFIAGDADDDRPVLHEAAAEGTAAGRNAAHPDDVRPVERAVPLSLVFTDPEIATVGGGRKALKGESFAEGSADLSESGRARVMGRNAGLIRVFGGRSDRVLLGGEMVGPESEHLGHLLAWAVQRRLTVEDALTLPFYHPTMAESLRTAFRDLAGDLDRPS